VRWARVALVVFFAALAFVDFFAVSDPDEFVVSAVVSTVAVAVTQESRKNPSALKRARSAASRAGESLSPGLSCRPLGTLSHVV